MDLYSILRGVQSNMTVTFFGHRNTSADIYPQLMQMLIHLIQDCGADNFLVGRQGSFDLMIIRALKSLKKTYPNIKYSVVLAYMPKAAERSGEDDDEAILNQDETTIETIYPDGLEFVHPKYAYAKRNEWMVNQADTVVAYILHTYGGAYRFVQLAIRKGKRVINLAESDN